MPYIVMKNILFKFTFVLVVFALLICCADRFPGSYVLEMPKTPEIWVKLLGEPHWQIEWVNPGGQKNMTDIAPYSSLEIDLPVTWTNPVTAWPYWPEHNLIPGFFKPAGALFPFDAKNGKLCLSWEAGPDTIFYWELVIAGGQDSSRIPAKFDWPRFRELFKTATLNEAVRIDPWLVNWRSVAERTVSGNFDSRRLVPEAANLMNIPVPAGFWYGSSPFAKPHFFSAGENSKFPIRPGINVWISVDGILRVNGDVWVFTEY